VAPALFASSARSSASSATTCRPSSVAASMPSTSRSELISRVIVAP
jgi:hypothetical protein